MPYATPLEEAETFTDEARDLVTNTSRLVEDGLPVHSLIRYGHSSARAIIGSVREKKTDFLILGWRGYARREHHAMGSTLDPVVRWAPCDIVVVKPDEEDPEREVKSILLPLRGQSAHRGPTVQVARLIAKKHNARVTILHVKPHRETEAEAVKATQSVPEQMETPTCVVKILESDDLVSAIVEESMNHDLVVIGATEISVFRQFLFGSIPEELARRCPRTVLMVKKKPDIRSHFRRLWPTPY